ncbi:MAG: glycosyltransferase [Candidatus Saccharimonadales bacterium]
MRVIQVSESAFTIKGHGVHTAFTELRDALASKKDVEVLENTFTTADIVHIHTVGAYALFFLLFSRSKKVVSAHVVPESLRGSLIGSSVWLPLAKVYLRWFYNRADAVFAVSDSTKRELLDMGVKSRVEVVYNLIDTDKYISSDADRALARKELDVSQDAWVVVGAGQVQPRKRVDSFIAAAKVLPDVEFIWVGGMPFGRLAADNSAMKQIIETAPKNVTFTGVIDHQAVLKYYQAGNVFWLPSIQETFGLVVVEAAAAGLPVMVRDIPDYKETFADYVLMKKEEEFVPTLQKLMSDKAFYTTTVQKTSALVEVYGRKGVNRVLDVYTTLLK